MTQTVSLIDHRGKTVAYWTVMPGMWSEYETNPYIGQLNIWKVIVTAADVIPKTVWAVIDLCEAPGACPTVHIASTEEKAVAWAAAHRCQLPYGHVVTEWKVDSE